jgi:hypothetical protein
MNVPINPKLPPNFDNTPNEQRPKSHEKWWNRPYIRTECWDDWDSANATPDRRARWFAAWPSGTRYDVRCLDGGAWDRSTCWGSFATLEEAITCAQTGARWLPPSVAD